MNKKDVPSDCVIQILQTATILWRAGRRLFQEFGLTDAQFNILNVLGASNGGMSQRELSEKLVVDTSNTTMLLDRMTKRGWVCREDVPGDRRRYQVVLTKAGQALLKKVYPHYVKAMEDIMDGISGQDVEVTLRVLRKIGTLKSEIGKAERM